MKTRTKYTRFTAAFVCGIIALVAVGNLVNWDIAPLAAWDIFALMLVGMIWRDFSRHTGDETATIARRDDMGAFFLDGLVVVASIISLGAVVVLVTTKQASTATLGFGLASVVISWLTVHTLYSLRYAVTYYRNEEGGIDFNDRARPRYTDFAYLAFTIGMTYQVSDTNFTSHTMRRIALTHALISFIFGVVIIATSINAVLSYAH